MHRPVNEELSARGSLIILRTNLHTTLDLTGFPRMMTKIRENDDKFVIRTGEFCHHLLGNKKKQADNVRLLFA